MRRVLWHLRLPLQGGRSIIPGERGERSGEFRLILPPEKEVRGEFVRRLADYLMRPLASTAFGPLTPKPGETIQLGDLLVP